MRYQSMDRHAGLACVGAAVIAPETRRVLEGLLQLFALPLYMIWHFGKFANTRQTIAGKVGTFVFFIPVIVIGSALWGTLWAFLLHIVWRLAAMTGRP